MNGKVEKWSPNYDGNMVNVETGVEDSNIVEKEYVDHSDYAAMERERDELAMLVRMFVHAHRKAAPGNMLCDKALDYLRRHGLEGSILRDNELAIAAEGGR